MHEERKSGLTLIELLVVLAIIGVITTISVPTIASMTSPKHTLRKQGRKIFRLMNEARSVAMNRKIRIDVYVDPVLNEVRAVESSAYRSLMMSDPYEQGERDEEEWAWAMSNRFERVFAFDDDYALEAFSVDQIAEPIEEDELFEAQEEPDIFALDEEAKGEVLALSFTHFGGSDGGGISLFYEDAQLNIATDLLTGRPKIVMRTANE